VVSATKDTSAFATECAAAPGPQHLFRRFSLVHLLLSISRYIHTSTICLCARPLLLVLSLHLANFRHRPWHVGLFDRGNFGVAFALKRGAPQCMVPQGQVARVYFALQERELLCTRVAQMHVRTRGKKGDVEANRS